MPGGSGPAQGFSSNVQQSGAEEEQAYSGGGGSDGGEAVCPGRQLRRPPPSPDRRNKMWVEAWVVTYWIAAGALARAGGTSFSAVACTHAGGARVAGRAALTPRPAAPAAPRRAGAGPPLRRRLQRRLQRQPLGLPLQPQVP